MLEYLSSADAARAAGRERFQGYCCIEEIHRSSMGFKFGPLDGAHIFSAGQFVELAKCPLNVVPVCRYRHNNPFGFDRGDTKGCMDLIGRTQKPALQRIEWLLTWVGGEYRRRIVEQIEELVYEALLVSDKVRAMEEDLVVLLAA